MNDNISLYLSLPNAVDMALGSPELGAANFNLLNAVLQALIRQIKLEECFVKIRGPDEISVRRLMASAHLSVPVTIPEYDKGEKRGQPNKPPVLPETDELIRTWTVEIMKPEKVIVPILQPEAVVPLTKELFAQYQSDMADVKKKLNDIMEIPNDSNIIEAMRALKHKDDDHKISLNPVNEMWNTLSIRKRVESVEVGLDSLAVELDTFRNDVNELLYSIPNVESNFHANENFRMKTLKSERKRESKPSVFVNLVQRLDAVEKTMEKLMVARRESVANPKATPVDQSQDIIYLSDQLETHKNLISNLDGLMTDVYTRLQELSGSEEMFKEVMTMKSIVTNLTDRQKFLSSSLNKKVEELTDYINTMHNKYIDENRTHMEEIEKELDAVLKRVNFVLNPDEQLPVGELSEKVIKLEKEMSAVSKQISEDKSERKLAMETLSNQIESLNLLKANQEYVDEALDDKLDADNLAIILNRKVSQHKFETAYEQLTRNIEEATAKLSEQETRWNATLEEIQATVGSKINKTEEIESLRMYVNKKVKALQRRLKSMSEPKEIEAAATKKTLRDLNCISCDQPVVMKKFNEHSLFPIPPLVTGKPSMRPYHAFKLDEIRKQENWKLAKELNSSQNTVRQQISSDKNIANRCTRYYGGSHTITNCQQRLSRPGHFLDQWGPKAIPLPETYMVGSDGRVYKARGFVPNQNKRYEPPRASKKSSDTMKKPARNSEDKPVVPEMDSKDEQLIVIKDLTIKDTDMVSETETEVSGHTDSVLQDYKALDNGLQTYRDIDDEEEEDHEEHTRRFSTFEPKDSLLLIHVQKSAQKVESESDLQSYNVLSTTPSGTQRPNPVQEPKRASILKPVLKKSISTKYSSGDLGTSDENPTRMSLSRPKSVKFVASDTTTRNQD